jgi:hypothetical protein
MSGSKVWDATARVVAGRDFEQPICALCFLEFVRRLNDLVQFFNGGTLIVDRHSGIRHDVDEKNMGDLELDLFLDLSRHRLGANYMNFIIAPHSDCREERRGSTHRQSRFARVAHCVP